jgi:hypothetical protein
LVKLGIASKAAQIARTISLTQAWWGKKIKKLLMGVVSHIKAIQTKYAYLTRSAHPAILSRTKGGCPWKWLGFPISKIGKSPYHVKM